LIDSQKVSSSFLECQCWASVSIKVVASSFPGPVRSWCCNSCYCLVSSQTMLLSAYDTGLDIMSITSTLTVRLYRHSCSLLKKLSEKLMMWLNTWMMDGRISRLDYQIADLSCNTYWLTDHLFMGCIKTTWNVHISVLLQSVVFLMNSLVWIRISGCAGVLPSLQVLPPCPSSHSPQ